MTEEQKTTEIGLMVSERNELRSETACLRNKLDRICVALSEITVAIADERRISIVNETSIVVGQNGQALPPVTEIMETQNRFLDATRRLDEINRRLDSV